MDTRLTFLLLGLILAACGAPTTTEAPTGDDDTGPGDTYLGGDVYVPAGDTAWPGGDTSRPGDDDLSHCGMPAYHWLWPPPTGQINEQERVHSWDTIEVWAGQAYIEYETGVGFARLPQHPVSVYRYSYVTQDRGALIDATATVTFPDVAEPTAFPVILFLHGTVGFNDACSPSRHIEDDSHPNFLNAALAGIFASWGYVVVMPDYIGLRSLGPTSPELHPYLVGEATAIAAWDSLRAADAILLDITQGTVSGDRVLVWGASQGGHAAAFTTRYGPWYAPEYDIAASVWAIPPTDLTRHLTAALHEVRSATANTIAFLATGEQWYGPLPDGLSTVFNPPFSSQLQPDLQASCSPNTLDGVTELSQIFTPALLAAAGDGSFAQFAPWACMTRENSLTTTSLPKLNDVPSLMILGSADTLVYPDIERDAVTDLCERGERLVMLECAGARHSEGFFWSIDDAMDFMEARLAGDPMPSHTCTVTAPTTCSNTP